jgi:hypothetical protein
MEARWQLTAWSMVRRAASVAGIVALSIASTLAVQHILAPMPAQAQTGQTQEFSATAFNLVDANGTVRARLGPNKTNASGVNLSFFDPSGQNRLVSLGSGDTQVGSGFSVNAADGQTLRIFVGNSGAGSPIGAGYPTIAAFDANGSTPRPRAALGQGTSGDYSLQFRDDTGQLSDSIS